MRSHSSFPYAVTLWLFSLLFLFLSCTTDSYEKGEGKYSLMQAEMVELVIDHQRQVTSFITDNGETFILVPPATASWIQKGDTVYRAILYFNKLSETTAESVVMGTVPTLRPYEHWKMEEMPQDPVGFESAWLSKNGKYLNVGLLIKTGQVDGEDGIHSVALAQDTILVNEDNTQTAYYRLLHDQAGVPEYYTNRRYISVLLPTDIPLDTIRLSMMTYDGILERQFYVGN